MNLNYFEKASLVSDLQKKSAIYTTIIVVVMGFALWVALDKNPFTYTVMMSLFVTVVIGVSVIRYTLVCRDKILDGKITYLQSVSFSIRFYFFSGLLLTLALYAFLYFHPNLINDFFDIFEQKNNEVINAGMQSGLSATELKELKDLHLMLTPFQRALNMWFSYMFFGVSSSLIYSLFLKKG